MAQPQHDHRWSWQWLLPDGLTACPWCSLCLADFTAVYASGIAGIAGTSPDDMSDDLEPLFDAIVREVSPPTVQVGPGSISPWIGTRGRAGSEKRSHSTCVGAVAAGRGAVVRRLVVVIGLLALSSWARAVLHGLRRCDAK